MGLFPDCGGHSPKDSTSKLKRGQLNVCTVRYGTVRYVFCVWCTLFPPAAEICAGLAGQFLSVVDHSKVWGK
jgi:hypothetical protein